MPDDPAEEARGPGLRLVAAAAPAGMTPYQVLVVIDAAEGIDPAAGVALRIAAVTGARRAEIAALRWDDLDGHRLTIDSSITVRRDERGAARLVDAGSSAARARTICIDGITARMIERLRAEREELGPYLFSNDESPPSPDRIGRWWQRAREAAGVDGGLRLDELHHSFGARVTHVLEFAELERDPGPEPATETVGAPAGGRSRLRARPSRWWRRASVPVVLSETAVLALVVFMVVRFV